MRKTLFFVGTILLAILLMLVACESTPAPTPTPKEAPAPVTPPVPTSEPTPTPMAAERLPRVEEEEISFRLGTMRGMANHERSFLIYLKQNERLDISWKASCTGERCAIYYWFTTPEDRRMIDTFHPCNSKESRFYEPNKPTYAPSGSMGREEFILPGHGDYCGEGYYTIFFSAQDWEQNSPGGKVCTIYLRYTLREIAPRAAPTPAPSPTPQPAPAQTPAPVPAPAPAPLPPKAPLPAWTYPELQMLGTSGEPDFFHETVPRQVLENPEWEATNLERKVTELTAEYEKAHPYVEPSHVCRHMAVELWQIFEDNDITSLIVGGNIEDQEEWRVKFECNHLWLVVSGKNGLNLGVECTNGTVYSPSFMRTYEVDCERAYESYGLSSPQWKSAKVAYDAAYARYEQHLEGYFYQTPTAFQGSAVLWFAPWNW